MTPSRELTRRSRSMCDMSIREVEREAQRAVAGNHLTMGLPAIPDFVNVPARASRQELVNKIKKLKRLRNAALEITVAYRDAKGECAEELAAVDKLHLDARWNDQPAGLSPLNLIRIGGRSEFAYLAARDLVNWPGVYSQRVTLRKVDIRERERKEKEPEDVLARPYACPALSAGEEEAPYLRHNGWWGTINRVYPCLERDIRRSRNKGGDPRASRGSV